MWLAVIIAMIIIGCYGAFPFPPAVIFAFKLDPRHFLGTLLFAGVPFAVLLIFVGPSGTFVFVGVVVPVFAVGHGVDLLIIDFH